MTGTPNVETSNSSTVPQGDNFASLLEESLQESARFERMVVKGTIISIDGDAALVDVGLKSEGRVALKEFAASGQSPEVKVGDTVEVYVERLEDRNGEAVLSREKARREEAWVNLEVAFKANEKVEGVIFGRVKGGFTVDLAGAVAFLPGSQVDIRPVRDITPLLGTPQPFIILKMDRGRGNIVVSRRSVLEETRAAERAELIEGLKEGQVLKGVVKNITDYGAFVDLGGVDGLLHVTDIAWRRINHPSDALQIGQTVEVQVIRFNPETQRISLGMKQLEANPWDDVIDKYPTGTKFTGRVTNITDYGAFVELEPGIEGLVHVSEMSWTKKNVHPGKIISTSQEVEVMVLDVDSNKRRVSLGLKQCMENPWTTFANSHPVGGEIEGIVKNITEFGLFIGLDGNIDGMIHLSDISWESTGDEALRAYKKGDQVKAKILEVDTEKERISLSIKQLGGDPFSSAIAGLKVNGVATCTVTSVQDSGIEVMVNDGAPGFIRRADLSRESSEQRPDRFSVGEKVDAKVTQIDRNGRRLALSIKRREIEEEKKAVKDYGSTDSGASLGDILGAALRLKRGKSKKGEEDLGDVSTEPDVSTEETPPTEVEKPKTAKRKENTEGGSNTLDASAKVDSPEEAKKSTGEKKDD